MRTVSHRWVDAQGRPPVILTLGPRDYSVLAYERDVEAESVYCGEGEDKGGVHPGVHLARQRGELGVEPIVLLLEQHRELTHRIQIVDVIRKRPGSGWPEELSRG